VSDQFVNTMSAPIPIRWQQLLPKVQCPLLLITSDPDKGSIVTPEAAAEAKRLLPGLQVARLPGAGHNIRREQFEAFMATVQQFIATNMAVAADGGPARTGTRV
jgi:pimeloyl-ACP methyl ester carboxylesterase